MAELTEVQMKRRLELVKQGLYDTKWNVNEVDKYGRTLLHFAASNPSYGLTKEKRRGNRGFFAFHGV